MKIDFHPNAAAQRPQNSGSQAQAPQTGPASTGQSGGTDDIQLSQAAQQLLAQGVETQNSSAANSPAFLAREAMAAVAVAAEGTYEGMPFGQVVKDFTPGHIRQAAAAAAEAEAVAAAAAEAEAAAAAAEAEGEDGTVTDGGEVAEGDETAPGDETTDGGEVAEGDETAPGDETTDGGEVAEGDDVAEGGDLPDDGETTVVVEEPDVSELLAGEEDPAPADESDPLTQEEPLIFEEPLVTTDADSLIEELIEDLGEGEESA